MGAKGKPEVFEFCVGHGGDMHFAAGASEFGLRP